MKGVVIYLIFCLIGSTIFGSNVPVSGTGLHFNEIYNVNQYYDIDEYENGYEEDNRDPEEDSYEDYDDLEDREDPDDGDYWDTEEYDDDDHRDTEDHGDTDLDDDIDYEDDSEYWDDEDLDDEDDEEIVYHEVHLIGCQCEECVRRYGRYYPIDDIFPGIPHRPTYVHNEVIFLADSEEEALRIAAEYGLELGSFSYGVGVLDTGDKDAYEVIAYGKENNLTPVEPNHIIYIDDPIDYIPWFGYRPFPGENINIITEEPDIDDGDEEPEQINETDDEISQEGSSDDKIIDENIVDPSVEDDNETEDTEGQTDDRDQETVSEEDQNEETVAEITEEDQSETNGSDTETNENID